MKEIDFLPEWYKEGKRRQLRVRRQYMALALIFLTMITYNLTTTRRITSAAAHVARVEADCVRAESVLQQFNEVTKDLKELRAKAGLIALMDSRIDVAAVLAEMSHVIGENVILSEVELTAEPFTNEAKAEEATSVRSSDEGGRAKGNAPLGDVRFKIRLVGIAAGPADVAALVCRLDESSYFRQVYPSFSRNNRIKLSGRTANAGSSESPAGDKNSVQVSEFEIICYLANYRETSH